MNEVTLRPGGTNEYTFTDDEIVNANIASEVSLVSRSLVADSMNLKVKSDSVGMKKVFTNIMEWYSTSSGEGYYIDDGDLLDYTYGDEITYTRDSNLYGRFFTTQISRVGRELFDIESLSMMGILARQRHVGGVYFSALVGDLIDEIMAGTGIAYSIDTPVRNQAVNGWLPYGNKRDNLAQILFAIGANAIKQADGSTRFQFNLPAQGTEIPGNRIYASSDRNVQTAPATKVSVTEHLWYDAGGSLEKVYSYSGVSADHVTAIFSEPIIPDTNRMSWDASITIHEVSANYVVFSGYGTIQAVKYSHLTSDLTWEAQTDGEEKIYSFDDATLVTARNSHAVLNRLVKFYTQAKQTDVSFTVESERAGDYIYFSDSYGNEKAGFIQKLDITISGTNRGDAEVITDWFPEDYGDSFDKCLVVSESGAVSVPSDYKPNTPVRFVLMSGFMGGQGGEDGEGGENTSEYGEDHGYVYDFYQGGQGGNHGGAGEGGIGTMVTSFDLESLSAFTASIGPGGAGGARVAYGETLNPGSIGGATTVTIGGTTYSTDEGSLNTAPIINVITGDLYNIQGTNGIPSTAKGGGTSATFSGLFHFSAANGDPMTAGGVTWAGGKRSGAYNPGSSFHAGPSGGGGAAYGSKGGDGWASSSSIPTHDPTYAGAGGNALTPAQAELGHCGDGGSGGGGGGGGCWCYGTPNDFGTGGAGGRGSNGGQGSNGLVLLYYKKN